MLCNSLGSTNDDIGNQELTDDDVPAMQNAFAALSHSDDH